MTTRERAELILVSARRGSIQGMANNGRIVSRPITLHRLANYGVPEDLTLPYETNELRKLVQELAQIAVD